MVPMRSDWAEKGDRDQGNPKAPTNLDPVEQSPAKNRPLCVSNISVIGISLSAPRNSGTTSGSQTNLHK